ncbi:MAG: hypothetical protein JSR76_01025 [Verrucomicrobia bacterium]|nr:hypothetical protein [Verrucomicrobiota bacterium]
MKKNEETRKDILNFVLDNVYWISDKAYQERVWIKGIGPECNSFDDVVCDFFGDGDPLLENYKDFEITNTQYELLKKFREEFDSFCINRGLEHYLPQFFIDTPEWTKITEMAKEVLKAFNYKKE